MNITGLVNAVNKTPGLLFGCHDIDLVAKVVEELAMIQPFTVTVCDNTDLLCAFYCMEKIASTRYAFMYIILAGSVYDYATHEVLDNCEYEFNIDQSDHKKSVLPTSHTWKDEYIKTLLGEDGHVCTFKELQQARIDYFKTLSDVLYHRIEPLTEANKELKKKIKEVKPVEVPSQVPTVKVEKVFVEDTESEKRVAELEYQLEVLRAVCEDRGAPTTVEEAEETIMQNDQDTTKVEDKRIIVVTGTNHMNGFDYECMDVDRNVKAVSKVKNADLIVFDTSHISHHAYKTTKAECVRNNVKYLHYGRRSKVLLNALIRHTLSI